MKRILLVWMRPGVLVLLLGMCGALPHFDVVGEPGVSQIGGKPHPRVSTSLTSPVNAMSLQPQTDYAVPERTAEVALAASHKGNRYMQMLRASSARSSSGDDFARLYPECGQPAAAPWRLALARGHAIR